METFGGDFFFKSCFDNTDFKVVATLQMSAHCIYEKCFNKIKWSLYAVTFSALNLLLLFPIVSTHPHDANYSEDRTGASLILTAETFHGLPRVRACLHKSLFYSLKKIRMIMIV